MTILAGVRSFTYYLQGSSLREIYWDFLKEKKKEQQLKLPQNTIFYQNTKTEKTRVYRTLADTNRPDNEAHLEAALNWILHAQRATNDGGVSVGYFPLKVDQGWLPSYPETTGYIITTMLAYDKTQDSSEAKAAALAMADWEVQVQMPSGAVQGGPLCPPEDQSAAAFNTGMVLDGWCSAYEVTKDKKYLEAGIRAARFLTDDLDERGYFRTNGEFVSKGEIKTYSCLCAWAMYRLGTLANEKEFQDAAIRSIEAAIKQQNSSGWFGHNCLTHSRCPLTHTIGYTLQGILEVGLLAKRQDFIDSVDLALKNIQRLPKKYGYLAGRFNQQWKPTCNYVCLTGSSQIAIVAYRMAALIDNAQYRSLGDNLLNFVKATQLLESENKGMQGAIAGSFPTRGDYMSAGYPNWATKYFVDALMLQNGF